ncbi:hypothetical protein AMATHDRAFT_50272 [Amanita thiersii Skay4041]|uniref:Uncharacterized protein n=1 Tax=Amanita thiersii Skay4041 TaxID=703135 RepID=A0A2A9NGV0_9AGAR|nr:hypothetical protein AMATHDRAFT_50272 [Amanita thiersii Skay4041]
MFFFFYSLDGVGMTVRLAFVRVPLAIIGIVIVYSSQGSINIKHLTPGSTSLRWFHLYYGTTYSNPERSDWIESSRSRKFGVLQSFAGTYRIYCISSLRVQNRYRTRKWAHSQCILVIHLDHQGLSLEMEVLVYTAFDKSILHPFPILEYSVMAREAWADLRNLRTNGEWTENRIKEINEQLSAQTSGLTVIPLPRSGLFRRRGSIDIKTNVLRSFFFQRGVTRHHHRRPTAQVLPCLMD